MIDEILWIMCGFIVWLLCGFIAAAIANNKGDSVFAAFFVGVILGPFGILVAILSGGKRCPRCMSRIHKRLSFVLSAAPSFHILMEEKNLFPVRVLQVRTMEMKNLFLVSVLNVLIAVLTQ
ncbi:MAG: hypothetical protein FJY65_12080 [Calditrichaeota bacterium]|nr:hypothetical protein [Calditrichota bacterium]